jgi:hypothetical protein
LKEKIMTEKTVQITVELTTEQAEALAQFVKRVGWSEMRQNAVDDLEAYVIRDGIDQVRRALEGVGYAPR